MIWFSIAVLIVGVAMLALKKPPRTARRPRAGSSVSQREIENPFDDVELDAAGASLPTVASLKTRSDEDVEDRGGDPQEEEEEKMRRGQGLLGKLFGGLPHGTPAARSKPFATSAVASSDPRPGEPSQRDRRRQEGVQRLEDGDDDDEDDDDVDGLTKYGGGGGGGAAGEEWGEFEKPRSSLEHGRETVH